MTFIRSFIQICLLLLPLASIAQEREEEHSDEEFDHHCLFEERSFSIGLALPYTTHFKTAGVNMRFYYNMGEKFCFGPEVAFFQKDDTDILDIDFVGHYIFETPWFGIYPLVGANYTREKEDESNKEEDAIGLVFGGGIHRNFNKITAFAEFARVQSELSDNFITTGFFFTFK